MAKSESNISKAEWESWLDPFNATQRVKQAGLPDDERAIGWIAARLSLGELRGAGYVPRDGDEEWPLIVMPSKVWEYVALIAWKDDFWVSGTHFPNFADDDLDLPSFAYARREVRHYSPKQYEHALYKVRFEPHLINEFCKLASVAPLDTAPAKPTTTQARRGAKRKDWWDHLWIEMFRRIRAGTLKPKNQTDLLATLEDYVRDDLNEDVGDSTLKPMAANLLKYLQEISGEIGENSKP